MNKHIIQIITIMLALSLSITASAIAEDMHAGHAHDSMDMTAPISVPMGHSGLQDMTTIRETMVNNYHLVYELIDMRERMKDMADMENIPPMGDTHHLMVYFHSPEGNTVDNAKVGYLITAPGGEKQKAMAMAMSGGFGADINLGEKGTYTISVKAVLGDKDVRDSFDYEVKGISKN